MSKSPGKSRKYWSHKTLQKKKCNQMAKKTGKYFFSLGITAKMIMT